MSKDDKSRRNLVVRKCEVCTDEFEARHDKLGKQCSKRCRAIARNRLGSFGLPKDELRRRYVRNKAYGLSHDQFFFAVGAPERSLRNMRSTNAMERKKQESFVIIQAYY